MLLKSEKHSWCWIWLTQVMTEEGTQEEALFPPGTHGKTSKSLPKREDSADDKDRERDEGSDRSQRQAPPTFKMLFTDFITATRDQEVRTN